jgi:hypothetical protein
MATPPSKISVVYGGITMGGANVDKWRITAFHSVRDSFRDGLLSFTVRIRGSSPTVYETNHDDLLAACAKRHVDASLVLGDRTLINWSHSGSTGFNSTCDVAKEGGRGDTPRSSWRRVSIRVQKPFAQSGFDGRVEGNASVSEDESEIMSLTVRGTWTAQAGGNAAYTQAAAQYDTFAGSFRTIFGGMWERIGRPQIAVDEDNKICSISSVYRQVIFNQSSGTLDNSAIVAPNLRLSRTRVFPGNFSAAQVQPLVPVRCSFDCAVRRSVTTDLKTLWANTIRPYLIQLILSMPGISREGALVSDRVSFDFPRNRLSAELAMDCVGDSDFLALSVSRGIEVLPGISDLGATTSDPWAAYVQQKRATAFMDNTYMVSSIARGSSSPLFQGTITNPGSSGGGDPIEAIAGPLPMASLLFRPPLEHLASVPGAGDYKAFRVSISRRVLGVRQIGAPPYSLTVVDQRITERWKLFREPAGGQTPVGSLPSIEVPFLGAGSYSASAPVVS